MNTATLADDAVIDEVVHYVLAWSGYRPDPSHATAVKRVVRAHLRRGQTMPELLRRVAAGDAEIVSDMLGAVAVAETYFYRQPEHFEWIRRELAPTLVGREVVRAWSAGCATGEEAYSIAACLLASVTPPTRVEVLGTDLLERNVAVAQKGIYGPWSHRASGPVLFPVCEAVADGHMEVAPRARAVTRFEKHSLLDPAPGTFDLILCRNVLLYFGAHATELAILHLTEALAPEGVLLFGTLDVSGVPAGLEPVEGAELNTFMRASPVASVHPVGLRRRSTMPPKSLKPAAVVGAGMAVPLHLRALTSIERGDRRRAERELVELRREAPDYLPGLFELALLHVRHGDTARAVKTMTELLGRLSPFGDEAVLAGPESLPVEYYRTAARAFLDGVREDSAGREEGRTP